MNSTPHTQRRVVVALSGGVDSSTAAALLVDQGYEVFGVMMRLWATREKDEFLDNICCSPSAVEDARRVCAVLGIPFHLVNLEEEFKAQVDAAEQNIKAADLNLIVMKHTLRASEAHVEEALKH